MSYNLTGKTVVITGATSGIGLAAAYLFVKSGAFVIGIGRSQYRNEQARTAIKNTYPDGTINFLLADLSIQKEVRKLVMEIPNLLKRYGYSHLDVLINNAGVYLEKKQKSIDGIEMTFAVNHLAGFLLTHGLSSLLTRSDTGRIISVSSYSHYTTPLNLNRITNPWPYIGILAYKRSKLCNVLFTYEFNRRFDKVIAFALDPGLVNTAIASKGRRGVSHLIWRKRREKGTSPDVPAQTLLYLAGEPDIDTSKGFYFKDCAPKSSSRKSKNADLANQLWEKSSQLTGLQ
ncbi:MAG: SDR family NAD(P)-dependent oxidoreductase [Chloroflexota bacterium]|nr:SDR family NAD(P)-dependent oxidoreductase [Chloroflexota bacterium]